MHHYMRRVIVFLLFVALACTAKAQWEGVSVEIQFVTPSEIYSGVELLADVEVSSCRVLREGELVSIRTSIVWDEDFESGLIMPLHPSAAPIRYYALEVGQEDSERVELRAHWAEGLLRVQEPIRLEPNSQFVSDTFVYVNQGGVYDEDGTDLVEYPFKDGGEYIVYAELRTSVVSDCFDWMKGKSENEPLLIRSNNIEIKVQGQMDGWETLKSAGLPRVIGLVSWVQYELLDQEVQEQIDDIILMSNMPWLIEFRENMMNSDGESIPLNG